jgi:hypothetical protein
MFTTSYRGLVKMTYKKKKKKKTFIRVVFDEITTNFIPPNASLQNKLFKIVM